MVQTESLKSHCFSPGKFAEALGNICDHDLSLDLWTCESEDCYHFALVWMGKLHEIQTSQTPLDTFFVPAKSQQLVANAAYTL